MKVPDLIGVEVLTPDGRGSILTLHPARVVVRLNSVDIGQEMKGSKKSELNYAYPYGDVEIIKGQYSFNDKNIASQYNLKTARI